jgi:signal transduction histidine kinase
MGDGQLRRIDLRAEPLDRLVRIEVEDTGPGLPADVARNAFEPFVRGSNASGPGVGLGLATVRRLVVAHGGTVGVYRGARGGCLFWFALPLAAAASRPRRLKAASEVVPTHAA